MDPGPHGTGRYSEHMMPEVEKSDFRKGSQVYCLTSICNLYSHFEIIYIVLELLHVLYIGPCFLMAQKIYIICYSIANPVSLPPISALD